MLVGVVYRPPNSTSSDEILLNSLNRLASYHHMQLILMGDFNLSTLENKSNIARTTFVERFHDILVMTGLHNIIRGPTRWSSSAAPASLDLILINEDGITDDPISLPPLGMSDHSLFIFTLHMKTPVINHTNLPVQDYTKANYTLMHLILQESNWDEILSEFDPDEI